MISGNLMFVLVAAALVVFVHSVRQLSLSKKLKVEPAKIDVTSARISGAVALAFIYFVLSATFNLNNIGDAIYLIMVGFVIYLGGLLNIGILGALAFRKTARSPKLSQRYQLFLKFMWVLLVVVGISVVVVDYYRAVTTPPPKIRINY